MLNFYLLFNLFPLPLLFKQGPFSIYYLRASRGGLRLCSLLYLLKMVVSTPLQIIDMYFCDTSHASYWTIQYQVVKACHCQLDQVEALIEKCLPKCTIYLRKLLATNVTQVWESWLIETLLLRATAKQLSEQEGGVP